MGTKDVATAKLMQDNSVFADVFNYYLYGGEQVIDSDSLVELDTKSIEVPYGGASGASQPIQRIRDVIKCSNDATLLEELINSDEGFQHLGRDEINVLNACVDAKIKLDEGKETINMCKALEDIKRNAAEEAAERTTKEVTKEMEKNRITGLVQMIHNLMRNRHLTAELALDSLGLSEDDRKIVTPLL